MVLVFRISVLVINWFACRTICKMLAYILDTKKIYGQVMFTSSMDTPSEYGFADNGDARKFFNFDAIELRG